MNIADAVYQALVTEAVDVFGIEEGNKIYKQYCDKYVYKHHDKFVESIHNNKLVDFFSKMQYTGYRYYDMIKYNTQKF